MEGVEPVAAVIAEEDTVGDLVAIQEDLVEAMQEDLVEVAFMAEVLQDILPDSLVDAPLVPAARLASLLYTAQVSTAVVTLLVELAAVVHFLEEAHNQVRTMLQAGPFMEDHLVGRHSVVLDSLAIRLPVQVMDGMVGDTTGIVPMVLEEGTHHGITTVHLPELFGVG